MPVKVGFLASCKILDVELFPLSFIVTNVELLLSLPVIQSPLYSYDGSIPLEPFLNKIRFILIGSRSALSTSSVVACQNGFIGAPIDGLARAAGRRIDLASFPGSIEPA
ncbi:hypothetical protein V6N13_045236 [Hibiscus sabdariffa]|uniref:Uncharacterized protein n=1 Tax=Hibiscus sabdariffa TaxID=183260 RepID=A0ABR2RKY1_9ROSI